MRATAADRSRPAVCGRLGIIAAGASLGAYHGANQLFRRPDLFDGMIAMSGNFDIRNFADGYHLSSKF